MARPLKLALMWGIPAVLVMCILAAVWRYRAAHPAPLVHFETTVVDRGSIAAKVTATGALSALVTVQVGSQVSGRIATLSADYGSTVKKGQTIATIEPSFFRAAVAQSQASYAAAVAGLEKSRAHVQLADRTVKRTRALKEASIMTQQDLDTAEADVTSAGAEVHSAEATIAEAKAALDQSLLNLKYTTIISPIDGTIISRNVDVGQTVAAALQAPTLFTIAQDLTRMPVDTNVAEADVGKIKPLMPVTFTVDAYPLRTFAGTVRQVRDNAQTLQNVVTYDAVVDVDNGERLLKPGMTASVTFTYATRDSAMRLPNAALRFKTDGPTLKLMGGLEPAKLRSDQHLVWKLSGERANATVVSTGITDGAVTEVLTGDLHEGDKLVVEAAPTVATKKP
jgi:HlyD family secretion protein